MTEQELHNRIESSQALRRAKETLSNEVSFRAGPSARFDPITIIMIISVIVQVLAYCRSRRTADLIIADIKNARALPRWRTRRLRQKLNKLWEEYCNGEEECEDNAFLSSTLDFAETATDEEIHEVMALAAEQRNT
jgi:hypothetical protein